MFWSDLPQSENEMKKKIIKNRRKKNNPIIEMEAGSVIIFYLCQRQKWFIFS